MDWVYFAAGAMAGQTSTIQFALRNHVIYRSSRNAIGALIAGVRNLQPGDRILLVYRGQMPHIVRVCAKIAPVEKPAPGTEVIQQIHGDLANELFAAGYAPVEAGVAEVIQLEDVRECHFQLQGQYLGMGAIRQLAEVDQGFERYCDEYSEKELTTDAQGTERDAGGPAGESSRQDGAPPADDIECEPILLPEGAQPWFDAYVMVDWSSERRRKQGPNSVWIGLGEWQNGMLVEDQENPPTRSACLTTLRGHLEDFRRRKKRVLVGFDFAFGYPRGFAAALGVPPLCWHTVLEHYRQNVDDNEENHHNRDEFAAACNRRIGGNTPGPFWGCPQGAVVPGVLTTNRVGVFAFPYMGLEEFRITEVRSRQMGATPQSVWKLNQGVSVGGQTILGIKYLADLRFGSNFELSAKMRVWPFETGWALPTDARTIVAEIFPSVIPMDDGLDMAVLDRAQVQTCVRHAARLDRAGQLHGHFGQPDGLNDLDSQSCVSEEGWILFVQ